MQLLSVLTYLIQQMVKFHTHKQLLVLMLHTTVILGILSVKTVFKFAHAKLMVVGLELNQFARVSGKDKNSVKPSPGGLVLKLGPGVFDELYNNYVYQFTHAVVDCGDLPDPPNGQVADPQTIFGSDATYSCNLGYTLVGISVRTCQESVRG